MSYMLGKHILALAIKNDLHTHRNGAILRVRIIRNNPTKKCSLMFVCICNALKEKEMTGAIQGGASCALDVYKSLGCQPVCGRCVPYVEQELLGNHQAITQHSQP